MTYSESISKLNVTDLPYSLIPKNYNCSHKKIYCVDDTPGPDQEYAVIQDAVDDMSAGEVVVVLDGKYKGFKIQSSGSAEKPTIVTANGNKVHIVEHEPYGSGESIYILNSEHVTIEGFTIDRKGAEGYGIGAHGATAFYPMVGIRIQFNEVINSQSTNIYMSQTADSVILGNLTSGSIDSHGIYLANAGADNTIVKGNIAFNNGRNGIHFNGDVSIGGDGLHSGLTVIDNVVYNNKFNGIDADGVTDSSFINNVIYKNRNRGIRVFAIDSTGGSEGGGPTSIKNLHFINNTIVDNGLGIKLTQEIGGHVFFNNIIVNNTQGCIVTENTNYTSTNNIYTSACDFSVDNENTHIGQIAWDKTGKSITSNMNKLFVDPVNTIYHLAEKSPALNFGISMLNGIKSPDKDISGISRLPVAIDAGAYEIK
jgi:hypothetical protein